MPHLAGSGKADFFYAAAKNFFYHILSAAAKNFLSYYISGSEGFFKAAAKDGRT